MTFTTSLFPVSSQLKQTIIPSYKGPIKDQYWKINYQNKDDGTYHHNDKLLNIV